MIYNSDNFRIADDGIVLFGGGIADLSNGMSFATDTNNTITWNEAAISEGVLLTDTETWNEAAISEGVLLTDTDGSQINLLQELKSLRSMLAPQRVLVKCKACGQWGAVMTPCRHCGYPIDPE